MSHPATRCLIAVGSNLGDRLANVRSAISGLEATEGVEIVAVSKLYETAPVGGPDNQGPFYNGALLVDSTLGAAELLAVLHGLEADRERRRIVRWGPRTLDLDLLVFGDLVSDDPTLQVPHPRQHLRRFVLVPVCDVAPDLVHPRLDRTMADLLTDLPIEPRDLTAIATDWHTTTDSEVSP